MRTFLMVIGLACVGVAFSYGQPQDGTTPGSESKLAELRAERVRLLEQRVSAIDGVVEVGLADTTLLIHAQMDLIQAKLDYAGSSEEKRKLLTELLTSYDALIELVEFESTSPQPPGRGQRVEARGLSVASKRLLLKAERIRIEIQRETLR